ncbi:hypothetical protein C8F01DRAFT_1236879 [Mycena amicta]|nr:hypothetical protein C8F01DRAFT_1236879 [Mycena amicta]
MSVKSCTFQLHTISSQRHSTGLIGPVIRGWDIGWDKEPQRNGQDDLRLMQPSLSNQCNIHHLHQRIEVHDPQAKFFTEAIMEIVANQDVSLWADIYDIYFVTSIHMDIHILDRSDEFTLAGTFMTNAPTDTLFLCLLTMAPMYDAATHCFTIPSLRNSYYWSRDAAGLQPLCLEEMDLYTPPEILFTPYLHGVHLSVREVNKLRAVFPTHQTNPTTSYLAPTVREAPRLLFNFTKASIPEPFGWSMEPYACSPPPSLHLCCLALFLLALILLLTPFPTLLLLQLHASASKPNPTHQALKSSLSDVLSNPFSSSSNQPLFPCKNVEQERRTDTRGPWRRGTGFKLDVECDDAQRYIAHPSGLELTFCIHSILYLKLQAVHATHQGRNTTPGCSTTAEAGVRALAQRSVPKQLSTSNNA